MKIKASYQLLTIALSAFLVASVPFSARAADFNVSSDTPINISDIGINLSLISGSTANSMTVNSSSVQFNMSSGQTVTLKIAGGNNMTISPSDVSVTCVGTNALTSQVTLAPSSDVTYTVTPASTALCTASVGGGSGGSGGGSSGGGGGGGGVSTPATPAPTTSTQPKPTATLVKKSVEGANGGSVELSDKSAGVSLPAGAFSGNADVQINPVVSFSSLPRGIGAVGSQAFDVTVNVGSTSIKTFSKSLTLTFAYSDTMVKGLKESTLKVQYWDETKKQWISVGGTVDKVKKIITVAVDHLTLFAVTGEKVNIASAGDLIKLACPTGADTTNPCRSVYYLGSDSKRYVFPNEITYKSWYADFSGVIEVPQAELQSYPIRANVTMRPGTYLVKITTDPKTYAVEPGGLLRWVPSETVAIALYGAEWAKRVVDVADPFFVNYNANNALINPLKESEYPAGTVIKYASAPTTYYYIEGGKKRKFSASDVITANSVRNEFAITAPATITMSAGTDIAAREEAIAVIPVK